MGIGFYIFNYIGAVTRWILGTAWRTLLNKKKFKFTEYLNGHNLENGIIGFVTLAVICMIILKLGI